MDRRAKPCLIGPLPSHNRLGRSNIVGISSPGCVGLVKSHSLYRLWLSTRPTQPGEDVLTVLDLYPSDYARVKVQSNRA